MSKDRVFVVDRIEDRHLVLVADDSEEVVLAARQLPIPVIEGSVLRVRVEGGKPDWDTARADTAEQSRRLDSVRKRMDELRKGDPGGDLKL
jgi:hypothetical protein